MPNVVRLDTLETLPEIATLGQGGQGRVWTTTTQGKSAAVKMYFPQTGTPEMRASIARLINSGPPSDPSFVWPIALVEDREAGTFGYLMDLVEKRFVATEEFIARRALPSFRTLTAIGWNLANAFLKLHADGYCYRDISFGNVRFDVGTGEVRILDNDNVTTNGDDKVTVAGTPRFMAPEIVRGEAKPSAETDRYSLSVLLFHFFLGDHPLDGKRETAIRCLNVAAMRQLYGLAPLYIFDPKDDSNRPDPAVHRSPIFFEPIYPDSLKKLFLTSFTEGLIPGKRITESIWRDACEDLANLIFRCSHCNRQVFYKEEAQPGQPCWNCGNRLKIPARLRVWRKTGTTRLVVLPLGKQIFGYHIGRSADRQTPIGVVVAHPTDPTRLGLENRSQSGWNFTRTNGEILDIPPEKVAPLVAGCKINFGSITGEIEA